MGVTNIIQEKEKKLIQIQHVNRTTSFMELITLENSNK